MPFKENILKKVQIERLKRNVAASLKMTETGRHVDKARMRELLAMLPSAAESVRDLELYALPEVPDQPSRFLVLDNELPIYQTDVNDIVLRRSPTLKEMLNIRNAIKILNDKDVLQSKTNDSLDWVVDHLITGLDLSHTAEEIYAIAEAGALAFKIQDSDGVQEALLIFAAVLELVPPPPSMRLSNHTLWGRLERAPGRLAYGPLVCYGSDEQTLAMVLRPIQQDGPGTNQAIREIAGGRQSPDVSGPDVFAKLTEWVLGNDVP